MADGLPSQDSLKAVLEFDSVTGRLTWRARPATMFSGGDRFSAEAEARMWNGKNAGQEAGVVNAKDGYRRIGILGVSYLAHRIAFKIENGEFEGEVDHINGDRTDNRATNLRAVVRSENMKNKATYSSNASGCVGVSWHKRTSRWRAYVSDAGKVIHVGYFDTIEAARRARGVAQADLGYHANHGRKARAV